MTWLVLKQSKGLANRRVGLIAVIQKMGWRDDVVIVVQRETWWWCFVYIIVVRSQGNLIAVTRYNHKAEANSHFKRRSCLSITRTAT